MNGSHLFRVTRRYLFVCLFLLCAVPIYVVVFFFFFVNSSEFIEERFVTLVQNSAFPHTRPTVLSISDSSTGSQFKTSDDIKHDHKKERTNNKRRTELKRNYSMICEIFSVPKSFPQPNTQAHR